MNRQHFFLSILLAVLTLVSNNAFSAEELITPISELIRNPAAFEGKFVSVTGHYSGWQNAPGSPPVTRSDWVLCDDERNTVYCTGLIPQDSETGSSPAFWKPMNVLAQV
jgi:hypothetical protein